MKAKQLQLQPDLAKLITVLDKKNDGTGNELNVIHGTIIGSLVVKGYRNGDSKTDLIKNVLDELPVLYVKSNENGHKRKSKFTYDQKLRTKDTLKKLLKNYWWPWSGIRKGLKVLCKN